MAPRPKAMLYEDPPNALRPIAAGLTALGRHTVCWRNPRHFTPDQTEPCEVAVLNVAGIKAADIAAAYAALGVPVMEYYGGGSLRIPAVAAAADTSEAEIASGAPLVGLLAAISAPAAQGPPPGNGRYAEKPAMTGTPLQTVLCDGAWKGRRCFIVGGGPSLKGFDFGRLAGELVIGVNRAFEALDPAILYSMDRRFLRWLREGQLGADVTARFDGLRATKVWMREWEDMGLGEGLYRIDSNHGDTLTWSIAEGLCCQNNSGFGALNLALCLGANPIYLLGFDMQGGSDGRQQWWHEGYPSVAADACYDRYRGLFEQYAPKIAKAGVRVVNLNPESALRCFEFGRFEELEPAPVRPLGVSYYTTGTGYEQEAQTMIASAHRMGLEVEARGIDTRGGWQANTYHKAEFLRAALDEHEGRDLLWLDADVEVKRYPELLDDPRMLDGKPADIAVNVVDWSRYPDTAPRRQQGGRELNTSVIYLRNNGRVRKLLDAWIEVNRERIDSGVWEQKNLQDVIEQKAKTLKLRVLELPDPYCQIFDKMAAAGDPVIELHQASRRLKAEVGK